MIRYVSGRATIIPSEGVIKVALSEPCKCFVALAEFHIPNTNQKAHEENFIDITCEQIDSTFLNPKRLLKRICFERIHDHQVYNHFEAKNLDFQLVDSTDKFLTLHVFRTKEPHKLRFVKGHADLTVYYTLAIKPIDENDVDRWIGIKGPASP